MKKKFARIGICVVTGALACALTLSFTGCAFGETKAPNPYQVASKIDYPDGAGSWLTENAGTPTEARRMYEEARADGYPGSYMDFLKEIGCTHDETAAVGKALRSAAVVVAQFETGGSSLFDLAKQYVSAGAGVIYSIEGDSGYIVTNYHVVYSPDSNGDESIPHLSDSVSVMLYGNETQEGMIPAAYVGGSMEHDIAVLRVENCAAFETGNYAAATAADSDAVALGEKVFAVGYPDLQGLSVTSGTVSVDAEYIDIERADGETTVQMLEMRTDAAINHGNSGGGLFNADGELLGIVNARSEKDGVVGFGYAIPSNLALSIVQNIIDNSKTNQSKGALRATLGVTVQVEASEAVYDEAAGRLYTMETVVIREISGGSAADGRLRVGDMIYSVRIGNGAEKKVTRLHMVEEILFNVRKGSTVYVTVSRDGKTLTVEIPYATDDYFTSFN